MDDRTYGLITTEVEQLKAEQRDRIKQRDGLIYATLAVLATAVYGASKIAGPLPLLAVPLAVSLLGWTYLMNDLKISAIGTYLREQVTPRLETAGVVEPLGWEHYHRHTPRWRGLRHGQAVVELAVFTLPGLAALVALWTLHRLPLWALLLSPLELAGVAVLAALIVSGMLPALRTHQAATATAQTTGDPTSR